MADYQLPRDVTRAGPQRSWVAGKVVSMRLRDLDNPEGRQSTQASHNTLRASKSQGKGKRKGKQGPRSVLEFYHCVAKENFGVETVECCPKHPQTLP